MLPLTTANTASLTSTLSSSLHVPLVSSLQVKTSVNSSVDALNEKLNDNTSSKPVNTNNKLLSDNGKGNIYKTNEQSGGATNSNLTNGGDTNISMSMSSNPDRIIEEPSSPLNLSCKNHTSEEFQFTKKGVTENINGLTNRK